MKNTALEERFDLTNIFVRHDGSYVVTANGMPYHVAADGDTAEIWTEVDTYAKAHPGCVRDEPVYEPAPEVIEAAKIAEALDIVNAHMRAATLQTAAFSAAEFTALAAAHMFDSWQANTSYHAGYRLEYKGIVYEIMQAVTSIENQPPDAEGMLAVYRPLSIDACTGEEPDGSKDNPYTYLDGMNVYSGKHYSYDGKLWLAKADMLPCTWNPGTAGLWQWEEVVAQD